MTMKEERVEWTEVRKVGMGCFEMFFIIAEGNENNWEFSERSAWEIQWFSIPSTPHRIARALEELAIKSNTKSLTQAA
jgi:hypothetical protein